MNLIFDGIAVSDQDTVSLRPKTIAGLSPLIAEIATEAESAPLDAIGGCAVLSDIASMRHETQETRLFRS